MPSLRESDTSFGLANCGINMLQGPLTMTAFVALGSGQLRAGLAQMTKGIAHVRLIGQERCAERKQNGEGKDACLHFSWLPSEDAVSIISCMDGTHLIF